MNGSSRRGLSAGARCEPLGHIDCYIEGMSMTMWQSSTGQIVDMDTRAVPLELQRRHLRQVEQAQPIPLLLISEPARALIEWAAALASAGWLASAPRLSQPEDAWQPFEPPALGFHFYG